MRIAMFLAVFLAVVGGGLLLLPSIDAFQDPGAVQAKTRLLNGKAETLEIDNTYKAELNALTLRERELDLQQKQIELEAKQAAVTRSQQEAAAAMRQQEQWASELIGMAWTVLYTALGVGTLLVSVLTVTLSYRSFVAPSLEKRWAAVPIALAPSPAPSPGTAPVGVFPDPISVGNNSGKNGHRQGRVIIPFERRTPYGTPLVSAN